MRNLPAVFQEVKKLRDMEDLLSFFDDLDLHGKFYSLYNAAMICLQMPRAGVVLSRSEWEERGIRVKEGKEVRPIIILVPFGPIKVLFEQSDVEGTDDASRQLLKDLTPELFDDEKNEIKIDEFSFFIKLRNVVQSFGIKLETSTNYGSLVGAKIQCSDSLELISSDGKSFRTPFVITYNEKHALTVKAQSILHELGHFMCGHLYLDNPTVKKGLDKTIKIVERDPYEFRTQGIDLEKEAELVSQMVCRNFGIGTITREEMIKNYSDINIDYVIKSVDKITKRMQKYGFKRAADGRTIIDQRFNEIITNMQAEEE